MEKLGPMARPSEGNATKKAALSVIKVSLDGSTCTYPWCLSVGMLRSLNIGLSTPTPITLRPLSTYITVPVTAEAKGDAKKAAALPTSSVPSVF
jgi:hypothetical protein